MTSHIETSSTLPTRAGAGLKSSHYADILTGLPDIGWFEIHAENYMGDGGPPHEVLRKIREHYPLSCHGVGLSIGSARSLDRAHLARLDKVCKQYNPGLFSEHLAWSTHDNSFLNDLLPVPYDEETLGRVVKHIDLVQQWLGRQMLLENPSVYVAFEQSTMSEIDFLGEVVKRTGCGLLLDINNVYVSAINQGYSPEQYLQDFPVDAVGEIHLGGHAVDQDDNGDPLLIDAHDRKVDEQVWQLFEDLIVRIGPRPTLIEWDNDVPDWPTLFAEVRLADEILLAAAQSRTAPHAA